MIKFFLHGTYHRAQHTDVQMHPRAGLDLGFLICEVNESDKGWLDGSAGNDFSSTPETHRREENWLPEVVLGPPHGYHGLHVCSPTPPLHISKEM